jgi:hypothetical protein
MHKLITLTPCQSDSGTLVSIQGHDSVPFDISRVFYIYGVDNKVMRGAHANLYSQFFLIAICGSCRVKIKTPCVMEDILLDKPDLGLWLDSMVWKEMYDFSKDCVLLVLSDQKYNPNEYIRDYLQYLEEIKKC